MRRDHDAAVTPERPVLLAELAPPAQAPQTAAQRERNLFALLLLGVLLVLVFGPSERTDRPPSRPITQWVEPPAERSEVPGVRVPGGDFAQRGGSDEEQLADLQRRIEVWKHHRTPLGMAQLRTAYEEVLRLAPASTQAGEALAALRALREN